MPEPIFINWYVTIGFGAAFVVCFTIIAIKLRDLHDIRQWELRVKKERPAFIEQLNQLEKAYDGLLESKEYVSQYDLENCRKSYSRCLSVGDTNLYQKCLSYGIKKPEHLKLAK